MYENEWSDPRAFIIWPKVRSARTSLRVARASIDTALGDLLDRWVQALDADDHPLAVNVLSPEYSLDAALAQFLNDLARQVGDAGLADRTGQLILQLKQRALDTEAAMLRQIESDSQRMGIKQAVTQFCFDAVFKRGLVHIDVTRYVERIDAVRPRLQGTETLRLLDNYFDAEKKLMQVYEGVRNHLVSEWAYRGTQVLPTDEELLSCAQEVMTDIHRRAEMYLRGKLG